MTANCLFCEKLARLDELPADELVWQSPTAVVLLGPWQYYHGYCVLVARTHATELHHLPADERRHYFDDLCRLAFVIETEFRPRKLNYELLGNQAPHLHWHLFPRYETDPNHLQAVWIDIARANADPAMQERLLTGPMSRAETAERIRRRLAAS
jgi:diadenosine tetraphosphate (Ap4A) HIT family hydrolase